MPDNDLEKPSKAVQRTNLDTAYYRSFSDIPNAKRVAELVHAREATEEIVAEDGGLESVAPRIPYFEARYKALDTLIAKRGITQVVEFAAGRTTRVLNNPQWNYIYTEQDSGALDQMMTIANQLGQKRNKPHFVRLDAITGDGLNDVMGLLKDEKVAVIHEGLITYYDFETKAKIARNAQMLLKKFGGIYATPDVHTYSRDMLSLVPNLQQHERNRIKRIGRDLPSFRFGDRETAIRFYSGLGFEIKTHKIGDLVPSLSSTEALFPDPEKRQKVDAVMKNRLIWEMTLS
jgi:O-methyltransferase involved in polyketide biosynthesis